MSPEKAGSIPRWLPYATVLVIAGIMAYSLRSSWNEFLTLHPSLLWRPFLAAFCLQALGLGMAALVWSLILAAVNKEKDWRRDFRVFLQTNLVRKLPGPFWFLVSRGYLYRQAGVRFPTVALASALETTLMALAGLMILLFVLPFQQGPGAGWPFYWLVPPLVLGAVLIHPPVFNMFGRWVGRRFQMASFTGVDLSWRRLLVLLILNLVILLLGGLVLFFLANTLFPVPWKALGNITAAWAGGMVGTAILFWLPGGLGLVDGLLFYSFSGAVTAPAALLITAFWRACSFLFALFWAMVAKRL
jgi:hypothetical protein